MRTRTRGIALIGHERVVDKQYHGQRIYARLGAVSQDDAEAWLRAHQATLDQQRQQQQLSSRGGRVWADGALKYLTEAKERNLRTLDLLAYHVQLLLPYIGQLPIAEVCNDSMGPFKAARAAAGAGPATINRSLEVVRTVTNRAARVWRDDGKPWVSSPPLIEMLTVGPPRRPNRPISWAEQRLLLPALPAHLQRPALFTINTGARDENVCGLRWDWEVPVPELGRSVFLIPPEDFKSNRAHVLILNDAAWSVVQACRGMHPEYVFVYRRERVKHLDQAPAMEYHRMGTLNNTAWQKARKSIGLKVTVHGLRHTFGQRLRDAGVPEEDRALLLGHAVAGMPQHYATATVARLVEQANKVAETADRTTLLRVVNG